MANQRKQIIVNEIAFWKQNKMLPAHYCDYLTSLYTGGSTETEQKEINYKEAVLAKERKSAIRKVLIFPAIAVILLILFQFVSITWLAIAIGSIVGIALIILGIRFTIKKNIAAPILHVSGALILLAMSVKLFITYFSGNNIALFIVLGLNCALWIVIGIWQKLIYFLLAGGLGVLVVAGYAFIFL